MMMLICKFAFAPVCAMETMQLDFPVKPKGQLQKENDCKFLQMLRDQKRGGAKVSEGGLYEMLQEYMIENDMLR